MKGNKSLRTWPRQEWAGTVAETPGFAVPATSAPYRKSAMTAGTGGPAGFIFRPVIFSG